MEGGLALEDLFHIAFIGREVCHTSCPNRYIVPSVGVSKPEIMRNNVLDPTKSTKGIRRLRRMPFGCDSLTAF